MHSPIMKGCFSCPQPDDVPTVEGCAVAHLSDSTKEIENLCSLLFGLYQYIFLLLAVRLNHVMYAFIPASATLILLIPPT